MSELSSIQTELKVKKGQFNKFGNYKYRSCEDILEGLKPLLAKYKCSVIMHDTIEMIGDRFYVKASASLIAESGTIIGESTGWARESEAKKGMDAAQITGSTSSYARKYALNGLFCIDDSKDDDTRQNTDTQPQKNTPPKNDIRPQLIQQANKLYNQLAEQNKSTKKLDAWAGKITSHDAAALTTGIEKMKSILKGQ